MAEDKKDLTGIMELEKTPVAPGGDPFAVSEIPIERVEAFESLDDYSKHSPTSEAPAPVSEFVTTDFATTLEPAPLEPAPLEPTPPENLAPPPPLAPMEKVKNLSEKMNVGAPTAAAAYPFTLRIDGKLADYEKERLLDLLSRENYGFREVDLEPMFEAGKILLPRISEYAGILVIQALRSSSLQIRFAPSDQPPAEDGLIAGTPGQVEALFSPDDLAPSEKLPLTTEDRLPELPSFKVIDTIVSSISLKSRSVELENSAEYLDAVEALKRELKLKAYRRGAGAVVSFNLSLSTLQLPTHYRLTATGVAVTSISNT